MEGRMAIPKLDAGSYTIPKFKDDYCYLHFHMNDSLHDDYL